MRRTVISLLLALSCCIVARGSEFNSIPSHWKWISGDEIAFSHDGSFKDSLSFSICARNGKRTGGICFPPRFQSFPVEPEGAQNLTFSPDSTMLAFTREGNLFVLDISSGKETGLTSDGGPAVYNGYASWVYYEEILGRASRYKAFWWSPDGKWLAFYRFDDSKVPVFPIYSPFGGGGKLRETRYPRAGESNPEVRIGFADVKSALSGSSRIVWADFDPESDQYFGIPFWSRDSRFFYVSREPRIQNTLELYAVSPENGRKAPVYREVSSTWLDWIEGMLFSRDGLYMARSFESDWQQVYFLSYDGSVLRRLTDGTNWNVRLEKVLPDGTLFFTANRDSQVRRSLYKVDPKGRITCMSDPSLNVDRVLFAPGGKYYAVSMSSYRTPTQIWVCRTSGGKAGKGSFKVADLRGDDYDPSRYSFPEIVTIDREGMEVPAAISLPLGFDPSRKYPVHVDIYGGPNNPMVRERWVTPTDDNQWFSRNGIIQVVADCRSSGHNGKAGTDLVYKHLNDLEVKDFVAWADYLKSLPYVQGEKIGVEGFSFGGTMVAMLLFTAPDAYHYGIAGGGVYDWEFYDTHYTERFMSTPQDNPEGYSVSRVINHAGGYPVANDGLLPDGTEDVMLKITHGTGDDNVHFQSTLCLIDSLHKAGKKFEFMVYPDGMHGYRGYQGEHFRKANQEFWLKYLSPTSR